MLLDHVEDPRGSLRFRFDGEVHRHLALDPSRKLRKTVLEGNPRLVSEDAPGQGNVGEAVPDVAHAVFPGHEDRDVSLPEDRRHSEAHRPGLLESEPAPPGDVADMDEIPELLSVLVEDRRDVVQADIPISALRMTQSRNVRELCRVTRLEADAPGLRPAQRDVSWPVGERISPV
jgi:hypothetical protein